MKNLKENILSIAYKTSSSFYSSSSLHKRKTTTHFSSTSFSFRPIKLEKKMKHTLRNFHKDYLKDKFLTQEKTLSVENVSNDFTNPIFLTKYNYHQKLNSFLGETFDINEKNKTINKNNFLSIKDRKYNIYPNLSERKENLLDFKNSISNIRKVKMMNNLLQREHQEIIELKKNEIEKIEMRMFQLKYTNDLLYKYYYQLSQYCKFLFKELDKEKLKLRKIMLEELGLKTKIQDYHSRIDNYKRMIIDGESYRNLLLCIKYHVLKLKDLPKDIITTYELEKYIHPPSVLEKLQSKKSLKRRSFDQNKKKKKSSIIKNRSKRNSFIVKIPPKLNKIKPKESKSIPLIYNTIQDFNKDVDKLDNNILQLFLDNIEVAKKLYIVRDEKKQLIKEIEYDDERDDIEINKLENTLSIVKRKNIMLINTLNSLASVKIQLKEKKKIYKKVISIIKMIPDNLEIEFNCPNFYSTLDLNSEIYSLRGIKYDTILFCLFILENFLMNKIQKINEVKNSIKGYFIYLDAKKKTEYIKRTKNSINNALIAKEKRIEMNNEIMKKMNKFYYLPKRKVNYMNKTTIFPTKSFNDNKQKKIKSYNLTFDDVLYY
jgi:hypothetical protein